MLTFYLALIDEDNSKEKFEILYERYVRLMLKTAYRYLGDRFLAEDAVHNAFLSVAKNMNKIDDVDSPSTVSYLLTVTRSCAIKLYHKNSREIPDDELKTQEKTEAAPSAEEEFIAYNDARELKDAIIALPQSLREPLLLRIVYNYPYKQIASIIGTSEQNCRKRIERAKKKLGIK